MMRRFLFRLSGAVAPLLLLGLAGPVAHAQLFTDNFNSGASPLWDNAVGNWSASGGVYRALAPNNNPATYSGLPFSLTDFVVDVDVNALQDGGIWLRSADNANGVLLVTGGNGGTGTGLYWHTVQGGNAGGKINEVTGLFTPGVSNAHLTVTVTGNLYSVFVNGSPNPATTLTTNLFPQGRVGLYDFSNQTFDNVVLTSTAAPEPAAVSLALLGLGIGIGVRRLRCR